MHLYCVNAGINVGTWHCTDALVPFLNSEMYLCHFYVPLFMK